MNGKHHRHFGRTNGRAKAVALKATANGVIVLPGITVSLPDTQSAPRAARELLTSSVSKSHRVNIKSSKISTERQASPAVRAGLAPYPANGNGGSMHSSKKQEHSAPKFRHLGEYDNTELRAVKFRNDDEADQALILIGKTPALKLMPFQFADGLTFIVPDEAVNVLRTLKLRFKASRVLDMDDLDPKERREIRLCQSL
jgi:hypothetical protein